MYFFTLFTVASTVINFIYSETTSDAASYVDNNPREENLEGLNGLSLDPENSTKRLSSLWIYNHALKSAHEPHTSNQKLRDLEFRIPKSLTRLAKTISQEYAPYFKKGFFEPFEKRPKPVTLVAFRKNGIVPGIRIKPNEGEPSDIAELQSPFNDISNFWLEEPDLQ